MEAPSSSPVIDSAAAAMGKEETIAQVDPFLLEALENPRHRLTVLRMELDIQRFMQTSGQYQFEFPHFPTSYLRRAAHRVAQHYGLQTMASDGIAGVPISRIIARKTPESKFPAVCLSELPVEHPELGINEQVKIAIRPRPSRALLIDENGLGTGKSRIKSVEERQEQYEKARARIFSGSIGPDIEGSSSMLLSDGRSLCSSIEEQVCYRAIEENDRTETRVAIFRDSEKDRSDPDYDRSYIRYARGLSPRQNFCLPGCKMIPSPYLQYEAVTFSQTGQLSLPRNPSPVSFRQSDPMENHRPFGSNQNPDDAVFMQWVNPAVIYAHSYDHVQHATFQPPFYQQPLSFEHYKNR